MTWALVIACAVCAVLVWVVSLLLRELNVECTAHLGTTKELNAVASELQGYKARDARQQEICAKLREASARMNSAARQSDNVRVDWVAKRLARIEGVDVSEVRQRVASVMTGPYVKVTFCGNWMPVKTRVCQDARVN